MANVRAIVFLNGAFGKPTSRSWEFNARTQPKPEIVAKNAKILTTDFTDFTDREEAEIWRQKNWDGQIERNSI